MLITQTDDGKMTGYPMVGIVAAVAAVISMVLVGKMRTAPPATTEESSVEQSKEPVSVSQD